MTGSRILVIDDSTTLRKLVEIAMRGTGIDIDFAATGSDGVSRARSARPDVILLDYLLPDLESTEVCRMLSDDLATAQVPVVVMSANQASVFDAFRGFPAVVDFVGKPFSAVEIRTRLESAIHRGGTPAIAVVTPTPEPPPVVGRRRTRSTVAPPIAQVQLQPAQLAIATRAISRAMSGRLQAAPADREPLAYFLEQLLDPEVVAELVSACGQFVDASASTELQLRGSLTTTPLLEILRVLASSSATGTLTIDSTDIFRVHLRRGEVVMCTCSRVDDTSLRTWSAGVPAELQERATQLQLSEGKPALITLAHAGAARVTELPAALHRESSRILDTVLGMSSGRFNWQTSMGLPDYVEAFGRPLSITSIAMARQRRSPQELKLSATFLDEVYDRTPHFSTKLAGARLEAEEQRLLALIDGRHTVREILGRAEISSDRAAAVFARLRSVDLIRSETMSLATDVKEGSIAVLDQDRDGFITGLRAFASSRARPRDVFVLSSLEELAANVLKQRVQLVLVNSAMCTSEALAREIAALATAGTITLVAVLDRPDPAQVDAMLKAGMHAVLTKPIHANDLERLLSAP